MSKARTAGIVLVMGAGLARVVGIIPAADISFRARQAWFYYRAMESSRVATGFVERAALSLVLASADARRTRCLSTAPSS